MLTAESVRKLLLEELMCLARPASEIALGLATYPWDCDQALVSLRSSHVISILERFLCEELSATDVEGWANAIECRDDIDWNNGSLSGAAINELANPVSTRPLTVRSAMEWLAMLRDAPS